ncbi:hypothetical protein BGZ68_001472 [Mortierella alpina]|nr:hypothetical protein BGZ68_001472 [Mortierella alpina]
MARRGGGGGGGGWSEETTYIVCGVIGGIFVLYMIYWCYKRSKKHDSPSAQPTVVSSTGAAGPATIVSVQNPNHNSMAQAQPLLSNYYAGPTPQGPLPPQPAPNGAYAGYAPVSAPGTPYAQPSPYGNLAPPAAPYPGMPSPQAGGYAPMPAPGSSQPYQY